MTVRPAIVRCPAKVNLVLRVVGRRPDAYHEIDTIFQAIGLWDTLELCPSRDLVFVCDAPGVPRGEQNLVLQAARLLRERHGAGRGGGTLVLRKSIPVQAGLGGGSSDAAGALVLCNAAWGLGLDRPALETVGRELGADVPYFLTGGTARGVGRGDCIAPLPFFGESSIVVGCPAFGLSTAEVFRRASARLTLPGNGVSVPVLSAHKWPEENDFGFLANDLESVVFQDWPELRGFRDALLEAGARAALLSGSGSSVFGVFSGPEAAARAAGALRPVAASWRVFTTRFVRDGVRWDVPRGHGEA